ncbi:uncharacterized protein [Salmo salar]|uniref:Uncharacterized protein n=1 Tax=Salmo salar TaxID=8030 RepID=A0ABM3F1Z9_SALSA|nr:uncharacterized protein LOC123743715 [Salmo salar]
MDYLTGTLRLLDRYLSLTNRPGESRRMTGVAVLMFCLLRAGLTSPVPQYDVMDELPPRRDVSEQVVQYGTLDQLPLQREMVPQVPQTDVLDQMIPTQLIPQVPQVPQTDVLDQMIPTQLIPQMQSLGTTEQDNQTQATSSSESQSSDQSHSSESSPEDTSEDMTSEDSPSLSISNSDSHTDMLQDRTAVNLAGDTQDDSHGSEENQRRNWLSAFSHYLRSRRLTVMGGATGGVRCLTAGGIGCELTGGLGGGTGA